MPSARTDKMYKELLEIYRESKYSNPELSLNYDIETLIGEGKSRERAILAIYRRMTKRLGLSKEAETYAERRMKELEKELNELRLSARSHAEEVEAIKKYLAYTHRLTTSQTLGRICFYLIGAALVILSFFQYRAVTIYIRVATGFEWVWILNCFVTLILGIATIALGWVLESMARVNPTF
jgi:VIT1/CCC1 family predicted Fe2+/Mn2+ transporter